MKQRYFIYLSYDGTCYHGWQIQPNGVSVQDVLQRCLSVLLRQPIEITGAGRTDAGVHARLMVAHFDFEGTLDTAQLAYKVNRMLPRDIAVSKIEAVDNELHARFSALSRTYHYYIHVDRNPFLRHYSLEMPYKLDFQKMNEAARLLLDVKDFGAFCKVGADVKTTLCDVTRAEWVRLEDEDTERWCFIITANRFSPQHGKSRCGHPDRCGQRQDNNTRFSGHRGFRLSFQCRREYAGQCFVPVGYKI
jgi:tRNA pseudouridine38-40 synthase